MVATFRNQNASPKESFVYHAAGLGGRGGSSYIDSVILRDRDTDEPWTSASDGALEERRFYCQNWRADVVAVIRSDGAPWEFVRYSAYGEPTVYPVADVNRDGVVNLDDLTAFGMGTTTGDFAATPGGEPDMDFDGDIGSSADIALFMDSYDANTGQSGKGRVSSAEVGNRKGYAGYEWDHVITMSHVRHRVYWPEIGRWTRRDPLGYVDGMSVYEYVVSRPVSRVDSFGLFSEIEIIDNWNLRSGDTASIAAGRAQPGGGGACGGDALNVDPNADPCTESSRLAKLADKWCGIAAVLQTDCNTECRAAHSEGMNGPCGRWSRPGETPQQYCKACRSVKPSALPSCNNAAAAGACCSQAQTGQLTSGLRCGKNTIPNPMKGPSPGNIKKIVNWCGNVWKEIKRVVH